MKENYTNFFSTGPENRPTPKPFYFPRIRDALYAGAKGRIVLDRPVCLHEAHVLRKPPKPPVWQPTNRHPYYAHFHGKPFSPAMSRPIDSMTHSSPGAIHYIEAHESGYWPFAGRRLGPKQWGMRRMQINWDLWVHKPWRMRSYMGAQFALKRSSQAGWWQNDRPQGIRTKHRRLRNNYVAAPKVVWGNLLPYPKVELKRVPFSMLHHLKKG